MPEKETKDGVAYLEKEFQDILTHINQIGMRMGISVNGREYLYGQGRYISNEEAPFGHGYLEFFALRVSNKFPDMHVFTYVRYPLSPETMSVKSFVNSWAISITDRYGFKFNILITYNGTLDKTKLQHTKFLRVFKESTPEALKIISRIAEEFSYVAEKVTRKVDNKTEVFSTPEENTFSFIVPSFVVKKTSPICETPVRGIIFNSVNGVEWYDVNDKMLDCDPGEKETYHTFAMLDPRDFSKENFAFSHAGKCLAMHFSGTNHSLYYYFTRRTEPPTIKRDKLEHMSKIDIRRITDIEFQEKQRTTSEKTKDSSHPLFHIIKKPFGHFVRLTCIDNGSGERLVDVRVPLKTASVFFTNKMEDAPVGPFDRLHVIDEDRGVVALEYRFPGECFADHCAVVGQINAYEPESGRHYTITIGDE